MSPEKIILSEKTHTVSDEIYYYAVSFDIDDSFVYAKFNPAEILVLQMYAWEGSEENFIETPLLAIQEDELVFCAVEEYLKTGTVKDAVELIPLTGKFLFRLKKEYDGGKHLICFYGYCLGGNPDYCKGLCINYPKEYEGTENERLLLKVLDEAAASYKEEPLTDDNDEDGSVGNPSDLSENSAEFFSEDDPSSDAEPTSESPNPEAYDNAVKNLMSGVRLYTRIINIIIVLVAACVLLFYFLAKSK